VPGPSSQAQASQSREARQGAAASPKDEARPKYDLPHIGGYRLRERVFPRAGNKRCQAEAERRIFIDHNVRGVAVAMSS